MATPFYESDAVRVDGRAPPVVLFEYRSPAAVTDAEVHMILDLGDQRIKDGEAYLPIIVPHVGTGLLRPRHRRMFSDWLFDREAQLSRTNLSSIVVVPERLVRALLRIVYRFRAPTLRTLTVPDLESAAAAARKELTRMGERSNSDIEKFLATLSDRNEEWKGAAS